MRICVCKEYEDMFTEGFEYVESLEEHDMKVRADAIDEFVKKCKAAHDGLIYNWNKPYGISFEEIEEIAKNYK